MTQIREKLSELRLLSAAMGVASNTIPDILDYVAKLERVVEAAENSFFEWGDSTIENEQRSRRLRNALAALRELDGK